MFFVVEKILSTTFWRCKNNKEKRNCNGFCVTFYLDFVTNIWLCGRNVLSLRHIWYMSEKTKLCFCVICSLLASCRLFARWAEMCGFCGWNNVNAHINKTEGVKERRSKGGNLAPPYLRTPVPPKKYKKYRESEKAILYSYRHLCMPHCLVCTDG